MNALNSVFLFPPKILRKKSPSDKEVFMGEERLSYCGKLETEGQRV